ncbi:hypothetical protein Cgig2_010018 [Carnegiea gigantea]|uniref:Aminotransferase-like plant mobile domain-containing protein n=1 Tax=Carnegiea gigantea TaxID=171969 RepID=A0A9Q1JQQ2_9CARY|nr:hypothetical protein Cgig2_010018 [Carnegiea gigantea]
MHGIIGNERAPLLDGTLRYISNRDRKCVDVCEDYGNNSNANVLEKVDTEYKGGERKESDSNNEKARIRKGNPPSISRQKHMTKLNVSNEVELAAFLSFWLSRFVLPYDNEIIRLETFVIAALMASGKQVSLASTVPGYIYQGLGEAASHPAYPGKANLSLHKAKYIFRDERYVSIRAGKFREVSLRR